MQMNLQEHPFHKVILEAYRIDGIVYSEDFGRFLYRKLPKPEDFSESIGISKGLPSVENDEEERILSITIKAIYKQFFLKVRMGDSYCAISEIKSSYGFSPEERIGISSGGYYRLFVVYWTFRAKFDSYQKKNLDKYGYVDVCVLDGILTNMSMNLGGAFFPTPGPVKMSESQRREGIQVMLKVFAPDMTIKDLYEGADPKRARWPIITVDKLRLTWEENPEEIKKYSHIKPAPTFGPLRCFAVCPGTRRTCTLAKYHSGPHVTHGFFKMVYAVWEE